MPSPLVLLVDDEPVLRSAVARALKQAGCEIVVAHDAARAIEIMRHGTRSFVAVIADLALGGKADGLDVLEAARQHQPGAARVLISGSSPEIDWALRGGLVQEFVGKPFEISQIVRVLRARA